MQTLPKDSTELQRLIEKSVTETGSLVPVLPLIFHYQGEPINLEAHYHFEPLFDVVRPRRLLLRCGRQLGKSFQNALSVITRSITRPYWSILYVTPLFEQVRRFSTLYVKRLIDESPAKRLMIGKGDVNQVLQRTFGTQSTIFMGYAQRTADRIRGISAKETFHDEFQLFFEEVLPVIKQVMGGSKFGEYESFAGTPLSYQNILERTWRKTSMSEWMIRCRRCRYDNVAAVEYDLLGMIGPSTSDIGPGRPGTVCRRCRGPIYPEDGVWWHREPSKWTSFRGLHLPQVVMPWHVYDASRWRELHNTLARNNETEIYNEILGEACDSGFRVLTQQQLEAACHVGHKNTLQNAYAVRGRYSRLAIGVDWGGGGVSRLSRTKAAVIGMLPTGKTHVIYGIDMNAQFDPVKEARALLLLANNLGCEIFAHDASGGLGNVSENILESLGILRSELWPMTYIGATTTNRYVTTHIDSETGKTYFTVDRSRTLQYLFECIKQGKLQFFDYDYVNDDNPGLMHDFMSISAELARTSMGRDVLNFVRDENMSDDFVHAVNFGCCALWGKYDAWPRINMKQTNSMQEMSDWANGNGVSYDVAQIEAALKEVTIKPIGGNHYYY